MKKNTPKKSSWIYGRLRMAEVPVREIAARLGVTVRMVHYVITGHRKSPYIRREVAMALRLKYSTVWGEEEEEGRERRKAGNE